MTSNDHVTLAATASPPPRPLSLLTRPGRVGPGRVLGQWQLWALAGLLTVGMLLSASMLQAGIIVLGRYSMGARAPARPGTLQSRKR